jgi:tripartite-type tricarboxylate transporter receptor subunit TctC
LFCRCCAGGGHTRAGAGSSRSLAAANGEADRAVRSGADITARILQEKLQTKWGKPVVIDNRPGGDGLVALAAFVSNSDPHTLLFAATGSFNVHPYQHEKLPYDAEKDLLPIARVTNTILGIGVPTAMNVTSLDDMVKRVLAEPGKMNVALVPGITEFVYDGWVNEKKLSLVKVPYRDIVQAGPDVAQGRIQFMMASIAILQPSVQGGGVKLLATNSASRNAISSNVPTVRELGHPELEFDGLVGLLGPRGMSLELREEIAKAVVAAASEPDVAQRLVATAQAVNPGGPAAFAASMKAQTEQIDGIAKRLGLKQKVVR